MASPIPCTASWRSRLAAAGSAFSIRQVNGLLPANRLGIHTGRALIATVMAVGGPTLPGTRVERIDVDGVRGEIVRGPDVPNGPRVMYYIHGSGYVVCSARTHRGLASRLSKLTGVPVFVIDYRLAPEHRFPAAHDDVAAGYHWLRAQGFGAEDIIVGGDSAGAHLALDLVLQNARTGAPQPAGVFMFSPLMDLTLTKAGQRDRRRPDPMAPAEAGRRLARLYADQTHDQSTRLAPTIPPGTVLPPLFVQTSADEMLADDARDLADMAIAAGTPCTLEIWPGRIHVFQALPLIAPEAVPALRRVAAFVDEAFRTARPVLGTPKAV